MDRARACRAEERLIRDFAQRPRLLDGERVVAIGPVEALGPLLTSPFTRKACIAYQYLIDHKARPASKARVRDYWGMAVTPFQMRTAAGPVRVLGYARLEGASSAKQALVPTTRGVKQLRIPAGSPEAWASESRGTARTLTGWGVGFAVLAVGGALATRWL